MYWTLGIKHTYEISSSKEYRPELSLADYCKEFIIDSVRVSHSYELLTPSQEGS